MVSELAHDRIINGLLKGFEGQVSPEEFDARLRGNIEIVASPSRATNEDLWPAIWALASVLERQLTGEVFINAGLLEALPAPVRLGPRVHFRACEGNATLTIFIGVRPIDARNCVFGDARSGWITIGDLLQPTDVIPSPVECFLLAGYLGFNALARLAYIPTNRDDFSVTALQVPIDTTALRAELANATALTFLGQGQVGQAFLALLFFLYGGDFEKRFLHLIDCDQFRTENQRTQILLAERDMHGGWLGMPKPTYIADLARLWNASPESFTDEIRWGWQRRHHPPTAFVGLHDFEGRRMACAAGFDSLIECGVGTNLLVPRISWHVVRGDTAHARHLFKDRRNLSVEMKNSDWVERLKNTPGQCGWVEFNGISATAPSLGIAAAAFAIADYSRGARLVTGIATLWSQLLPPVRSG